MLRVKVGEVNDVTLRLKGGGRAPGHGAAKTVGFVVGVDDEDVHSFGGIYLSWY